MKRLNKQEFEEVYNKEIKPSFASLEKAHRRVSTIGIILFCIIVLCAITLYLIKESCNIELDFQVILCFSFIATFAVVFYVSANQQNIDSKVKKIISPKIFSLFGLLYYPDDKKSIPFDKIQEWGLFPKSSKKVNSDVIVGTHNSRGFLVDVCKFTHIDSGSKDEIVDFCCIILKIKIKKALKGQTILGLQGKVFPKNNLDEIKLDFLKRIKGNRLFYSNNYIEAKELLTPLFLERLNKLDKLGDDLAFSDFSELTKEDTKEDKVTSLLTDMGEYTVKNTAMAVFEDEFLYVFIQTSIPSFDITLGANMLEESYNNYLVMSNILDVIDFMNLENDFNL